MKEKVFCYAAAGFDGNVVHVEVDIRRGIPGLEIVGLPDGAVREARDRVRVAIRNSGFSFPRDRILVNLAPADVRKEGSAFDLPIALAILLQSGEIPPGPKDKLLVIGELQLSGEVRPVRGVLAAVSSAVDGGAERCIVPAQNRKEACSIGAPDVHGVSTLQEAADAVAAACAPRIGPRNNRKAPPPFSVDFADIRGHAAVKRALTIAAAGRHHVLLFGPPGSGKSLAASRIDTILPDLEEKQSVEVTRIHSLAGVLGPDRGLIRRPPVRTPHHTASAEGLVGGGRIVRPGEISLAHAGVLILDEVPEFRRGHLQALREPIESARIDLARAGSRYWYPADFQLVMTANPCPCGNLGRDDAACICTRFEIEKYWKKLGGALLDRIDIRIPVKPVPPAELLGSVGASSGDMAAQVLEARHIQRERNLSSPSGCNGRMGSSEVVRHCHLSPKLSESFVHAVRSVALSARACHSVLKIARTIADLAGEKELAMPHIYEAVQLRRFGDTDFFWI